MFWERGIGRDYIAPSQSDSLNKFKLCSRENSGFPDQAYAVWPASGLHWFIMPYKDPIFGAVDHRVRQRVGVGPGLHSSNEENMEASSTLMTCPGSAAQHDVIPSIIDD